MRRSPANGTRQGTDARIPWRTCLFVAVAILLAALPPLMARGGLSTGAYGDKSWFWQNPLPQGNDILGVSYSDAQHGWAVGRSGVVLRTLDGGKTWSLLETDTTARLNGVAFTSTQAGWIVGDGGTFKKTTDGGATWADVIAPVGPRSTLRSVASPDGRHAIVVGASGSILYSRDGAEWSTPATSPVSASTDLASVSWADPETAYAVGDNGTIIKTVDGGRHWSLLPAAPNAVGLTGVSFSRMATSTGYAVGNADGQAWTVLKTTDGGATWTRLPSRTGSGLFAVSCTGTVGANVTVAGAGGTIFSSADGGVNWTDQTLPEAASAAVRAVQLLDGAEARAGGDGGRLAVTHDGGLHWTAPLAPPGTDLLAASFPDDRNGWMAGSGGTILSTRDGGLTWTTRAVGSGSWRGIWFSPDLLHGWVVGDGGAIRATTDGGGTWSTQGAGATSAQLNAVWFTDPLNGWAVGAGGVVLHTSNGGAAWSAQAPAGKKALNAVWFRDTTTGWAVGASGTILRTADGGATWASQASNTPHALWAVHGTAEGAVWVAGDAGVIAGTADDGATWITLRTPPVKTALYALDFADASHGWAAGAAGTILRTADGGATWTKDASGVSSAVSLRAVAFAGGREGIACGDGGAFRKTADGGASWSSLQPPTAARLDSLALAEDGRTGVASGAGGTMLRSVDGGSTWFPTRSGSGADIAGIALTADGRTGWAVGAAGTILRTVDAAGSWSQQASSTTRDLKAVACWDATHAVAVGDAGAGSPTIRYTTDGSSWAGGIVRTTDAPSLNGVCVTSAKDAWAVADSGPAGSIFKSTDSGATWSAVPVTLPASTDLNAVTFAPASQPATGWAVGSGGVIARTTDRGASWRVVSDGRAWGNRDLYAVRFSDASNGIASGAGGLLLRTFDGGLTWWQTQSGTTSLALRSVALLRSGRAWAVGDAGAVLASTDISLPVTTMRVEPPAADGLGGWYRTVPSITLAPLKSSTTWTSWDASAGPFVATAGPLPAPEGMHDLYYYSENPDGISEPLHVARFFVDSVPPSPPQLLMAAVVPSGIELDWPGATSDAASGVDHYEVYRDGSLVATTTETSYLSADVGAATTYAFRIVAVDAAGNASLPGPAAPVFVTTPGYMPPATTLTADPAEPDGRHGWYTTRPTITLTPDSADVWTYYGWDDASTLTTYTGPIQPEGNGRHKLRYYSVRKDDPSQREELRQLAFAVETTPPGKPQAVAAPSRTATSVWLQWAPQTDDVSGIDHYEVWDDYLGSTTDLSFLADGLQPSTDYTFRVYAVSGSGLVSPASDPITVRTLDASLPAAPSVVAARAPLGGSAMVDWQPVTSTVGAATYHVWRSTDGAQYWEIASVPGDAACAYVDDGLRSSTRYWYAVSVQDDRGIGEMSDTSEGAWPAIAPTTGMPQRPDGLAAMDASGSVLLNWTPDTNPAVAFYYVRRSDASLSSAATTFGPVFGTSYIDDTVTNGRTYFYSVRAVDGSGTVGYSSLEAEARPRDGYAGTDTHVIGASATQTCQRCHSSHSSPDVGEALLFTVAGPNEDNLCLSCHTTGSGRASTDVMSGLNDPLNTARKPIWTETSSDTSMTCGVCHRSHASSSGPAFGLISTDATGAPLGDKLCYRCHGQGSALRFGDMSVFEQSAHAAVPAPASGSEVKCQACHEPHASRNPGLTRYAGSMQCVQCHNGQKTAGEPDIWDSIQSGGAAEHAMGALSPGGAQLQCENCHNTHAATKTNPLVDPHDPGYSGRWEQPRSNVKDFCFRCHDGEPLPTSAETTPWAQPVLGKAGAVTVPDIRTSYGTNVHGFGAAESPGTTTTVYLRPEMGYAYRATLECDVCHEQHGSVNAFGLRQHVSSADGARSSRGLAVFDTGDGGHDLRFFCSSCHVFDPATHDPMAGTDTRAFPTDCTRCHRHIGTDGSPGQGL